MRVDATETEGWFYEGAGIYRHAWLVKTGRLAVAPDGVFVTATFKNNTPGGPAQVHFETRLANAEPAPGRRRRGLDGGGPRRQDGGHRAPARPGGRCAPAPT